MADACPRAEGMIMDLIQTQGSRPLLEYYLNNRQATRPASELTPGLLVSDSVNSLVDALAKADLLNIPEVCTWLSLGWARCIREEGIQRGQTDLPGGG